MATASQPDEAQAQTDAPPPAAQDTPRATRSTRTEPKERKFYRFDEAAEVLRVSRTMMYTLLRGEVVVDLKKRGGKKGVMLVPQSTLDHICKKRTRVFR